MSSNDTPDETMNADASQVSSEPMQVDESSQEQKPDVEQENGAPASEEGNGSDAKEDENDEDYEEEDEGAKMSKMAVKDEDSMDEEERRQIEQDKAKRFEYLLKQTEIFAHFMSTGDKGQGTLFNPYTYSPLVIVCREGTNITAEG